MRAWGAEAPSIRQPASLPAWQPLRVRASRGRAPARRPDEVPAGVAVARERLGAPPFHKEFPKGGRVRAIASVGKGGQTGEGGPSSGRRGKGASGRPMGEGGPRAADGQGYVTSAQLGSAARRTRELQRPPVALFPRGGEGGRLAGRAAAATHFSHNGSSRPVPKHHWRGGMGCLRGRQCRTPEYSTLTGRARRRPAQAHSGRRLAGGPREVTPWTPRPLLSWAGSACGAWRAASGGGPRRLADDGCARRGAPSRLKECATTKSGLSDVLSAATARAGGMGSTERQADDAPDGGRAAGVPRRQGPLSGRGQTTGGDCNGPAVRPSMARVRRRPGAGPAVDLCRA